LERKIKIDGDSNSTALIIPPEFAKKLDIENSKVLMFLLDDSGGNRYLGYPNIIMKL
jgi:hypothetical protein